MWKCPKVGCNCDIFIRNDSGSCKYYEVNYVDKYGTVEDTRDTDYEDHEIDDVGEEVNCRECGVEAIWVENEPKKSKWKDKVED